MSKVKCFKCGYEWVSRLEAPNFPKECPECKCRLSKTSKRIKDSILDDEE